MKGSWGLGIIGHPQLNKKDSLALVVPPAKIEHLGGIEVERLQLDEEVQRVARGDWVRNDLGHAHGGSCAGHRRTVVGQGRNIE